VKVQFKAKIPKEAKYIKDNEDSFRWSEKFGFAVLSDGASESFAAKVWSNLLVKKFLHTTTMDDAFLASIHEVYEDEINYQDLSWSKQAAYLRGSFATILALWENLEKTEVTVVAVGDSIAVLCKDNLSVDSFPYHESEEFTQRPKLLSTIPRHNEFLHSQDFLNTHQIRWPVDTTTHILLMTDALGAWCLKRIEENDPEWLSLLDLRNTPDFRKLVIKERKSGRMKIDDTSLLVLSF
jgi:protein phosphatase 2C-like protein